VVGHCLGCVHCLALSSSHINAPPPPPQIKGEALDCYLSTKRVQSFHARRI
jgi:hypothetical protein